MPKFAANLSMMFPELDEAERFAAARDAGFGAVEYLRPYAHPIAEVRRWLDDAGLQLILINSPAGDPARNDRGLAALPGREADNLHTVPWANRAQSREAALTLGALLRAEGRKRQPAGSALLPQPRDDSDRPTRPGSLLRPSPPISDEFT